LLDKQVPEAVKDARLQRLQAVLRIQQDEFNASFVGRTVPVLFERGGRNPGQLTGKTPWLQPVHATAPASFAGRVLPVKIVAIGTFSLAGTILDTELPLDERRTA
jgi:tRNA-2-methylthio-N6-dimethylallyladenosine synthase